MRKEESEWSNSKMIKIYFPFEIHSFTTKWILFPPFSLFFQNPPRSFPRPPHSFFSLLRSQGVLELRGCRAAESHWFRWKETDVLFTIAVTLSPRRTQLMADNYQGRQSWTGGGPIYFTRPFQVPDTRTARGQHGPAARQSRVWIPASDSFRAETRNTSLKLCSEAHYTICSAKHNATDWRAAQTVQTRAMLVGMDALPMVQHLRHWYASSKLGYKSTELIADVDVL